MSTKTMRLPPRRVLTASNVKNKRKEEEDNGTFDAVKQSAAKRPTLEPAQPQPQVGSASSQSPPPPNQLLAGYLAHEFLTKGTLFGQPWDSPGSEPSSTGSNEAEPVGGAERMQRYVAVSGLLSVDGSHLNGVVNPAQLASLLQLL